LYTAWWYSNGKDNTVDPFAWRYNAVKTGSTYAVMNVSAATEKELEKALDGVINKRVLQGLFQ
jgi:hypothetical protein